jgi:ABC-type branched-subunit amino acid transport system ATPase component
MNSLPQLALTANNITVMHGEFKAVSSVSLTLQTGEWVSLVGPNGAGKSSLLKALAGLVPAEGKMATP